MKNLNNLPYQVSNNLTKNFKKDCKKWDKYSKNVFLPFFKKELGKIKYEKITHSINTKPKDFIFGIRDLKKTAKMAKQPYFIYFDIKKFYPSISHKILIEKIKEIYLRKRSFEKLKNGRFNKNPEFSRDFKAFLKFIDLFLNKSIFEGKGIISGTSLGAFLAEIYLYDFFKNLPFHTFRWNDDFVIFDRKKDILKENFSNIILSLKKLDLKINAEKTLSGKLFKDKLFFLGFYFKAPFFISIKDEKIDIFIKKIKCIFSLKGKKTSINNILSLEKTKEENKKLSKKIKKLRRLQFGFFNFYKLCTTKLLWEKLNAKIRNIVRKWLFKFKSVWNGKFIIKTVYLEKIGVVNFRI